MDTILPPLSGRFDPLSVVGRRVRIALLEGPLRWRLSLPLGRITRHLRPDVEIPHIFYLVELDSPISFEFPQPSISLRRKLKTKLINTKHIIVEIKRVERIEEELQGTGTLSSSDAPMLYFPLSTEALSHSELSVTEDIATMGPGFIEICDPGGFDPRSAVGQRVHIEILLKWDLKFPEGRITRWLETDSSLPHIFYLVELDSPIMFELQQGRTFLGRKRQMKMVTTRYIIVEIRRPGRIQEELKGHVLSEWSAPLLGYPRNEEVLSRAELNVSEDIVLLGPCRIRIIDGGVDK